MIYAKFLMRRKLLHHLDLHSSGILCSTESKFCTDVSGQAIASIFKGQEGQEDFLTVEDGTDSLS
jgi:hypothetical protein